MLCCNNHTLFYFIYSLTIQELMEPTAESNGEQSDNMTRELFLDSRTIFAITVAIFINVWFRTL